MIKNNVFKMIILGTLCFVICVIVQFSSLALNIQNEKEIETLFNKMTENIAISLLYDNNSKSYEKYQYRAYDIENELSLLGVHKLSDDELYSFLNDIGISTYANRPSDSNTVKWYSYTSYNQSYGSQKYDVKRLIAVGNNPGGMLVTGADNVKFYSGKEKRANAVKNALAVYVQKAIGSIPVIQWTPYELLFSNSSENAFNSSYVTHRCVSSIEFSFVKNSSQSNNYYKLSKYSNKLSIAVNAHCAAVINSKPKTYSENKSTTILSKDYGSISKAIQTYTSTSAYYDYIQYYEIHSYDGQYSKKAYVPNPLAGPGQI